MAFQKGKSAGLASGNGRRICSEESKLKRNPVRMGWNQGEWTRIHIKVSPPLSLSHFEDENNVKEKLVSFVLGLTDPGIRKMETGSLAGVAHANKVCQQVNVNSHELQHHFIPCTDVLSIKGVSLLLHSRLPNLVQKSFVTHLSLELFMEGNVRNSSSRLAKLTQFKSTT